ncbi:NADH-quinone oxidoreductase subunit M [Mycolicibacterium cosmeticum]|uniref:Proton-translocating NADH-quinone oxidoreductase subunit M n=1 Tax=Mycolicibacterium cosmeticum TaxID=258533 RepID=W9ATA5_MYCCO|nr:NADH-quinone oxidoreductase subunit M [Mycolicibacterium cosmeticum]TLH72472.1 NADH-quinone oxidoreductase subunit M [Mycolicibacterium cosmeticum]CDO05846.1 proton-translocating NADH-quinone oxidoreductase subunit M [Mycolicibacterium cosmeticum]
MVTGIPWLTVLWLVPVAGAVAVLAVPSDRQTPARWVGLGASLLTLIVSMVLVAAFDAGGGHYQFVEGEPWMATFGAGYTVGLDGIGLCMVVLTTGLIPILLIAGWHDGDGQGRSVHGHVALVLLVEAMVVLTFIALDVLLFYVFFEAMLIPMYFLVGRFGGTGGPAAAIRFLVYNLAGGLAMLVAVIWLYAAGTKNGHGTFDLRELVAAGAGDHGVERILFCGFMLAFAIKAPMWPLHTWLPDVATSAKPATAVLMMAIVDKVGTFGMLRYCLQLFPDAAAYFRPVLVALSVVAIVYGAVVAIGQTDIMRMIAYASLSHFGFITLGIFVMTSQGQTGATLYMVNHGISTAALVLTAGFLVSRTGTKLIAAHGGVRRVAPVLAVCFLLAGLASLALPGLAPFVSEFLVLIGSYDRYPVSAIFAASALVLSAIYILWAYQRMMTGPVSADAARARDLRPREIAVIAPLLASLLVLGCYPKPVLRVIDPVVVHTLDPTGIRGSAAAEGAHR